MSATIVIPAYNAAAYVAEAVKSALAQSVRASRVVVVDDGSTDATAGICAGFGDEVSLLRQENRGVSLARQTGASVSNAEWLLFLDADDRLRPDALKRLLARASEGTFGVVYGQTTHFNERTGIRRLHGTEKCEGAPPAGAQANFWKSAIATPGAAIVRRSLFDEIGGFTPGLDSAEDREFWMKCGVLSEFGFVREPVVEKREHGANTCSDVVRAVHRGAIVQLGFFGWCAGRGIDTAALDVPPSAIIESALRKALQVRSLEALALVTALADERGIEAPSLEKARRLGAWPRPAAEMGLRFRAGLQRLTHLFDT